MIQVNDDAAAATLLRLVNGYQISQALHVAAELRVADLVGDTPVAAAIKSRVHFRRGFDDSGFAKTILLVDPEQPFLGTVRLEALHIRHRRRHRQQRRDATVRSLTAARKRDDALNRGPSGCAAPWTGCPRHD